MAFRRTSIIHPAHLSDNYHQSTQNLCSPKLLWKPAQQGHPQHLETGVGERRQGLGPLQGQCSQCEQWACQPEKKTPRYDVSWKMNTCHTSTRAERQQILIDLNSRSIYKLFMEVSYSSDLISIRKFEPAPWQMCRHCLQCARSKSTHKASWHRTVWLYLLRGWQSEM